MSVAKRGGLGKGLDLVIQNKNVAQPEKESTVKDSAIMIDINKIQRNKEQPRKKFDEAALEELSESIKLHGVLQPIMVQDRKDHYEIILGERRYRACIKAGITQIPAIIKDYSEQEIAEIALIENLQREDLDVIEEALAYKRLKTEYKLTDEKIAEKVSKSRAAVTNAMRLLKLSKAVQEMLINDKISMGHARALLSIEDEAKQLEIAEKIEAADLSVRETEKLIKSLSEEKPEKPKKKKSEDLSKYQIQYDDYVDKLSKKLGVKTSVTLKDKSSGKFEIDFYSSDDFEKIFRLLYK